MPHPTTPEVALRALVLDDADAIAAWGADAEFCRAAGWTVGLGHDEHLRFQRGLISRPPADLHRLGVETEGRLVGYVALQGDDLTRRELGFVIGERSLWHHGLGTAAARAALVHGFTSLHLTEI